MKRVSEDDESGLRISYNAQVASGTRRRCFSLSRAAFLAGFVLSVTAIRADETNAVAQSLCVESGSIITNVAQVAAAFDQPGLNYPAIWPWEPGMFEGQQVWFADFDQLPQELNAIRGSSDYEFHGVKFSALALILDGVTGAVTVKYPFSDTVLLQFDPPADYQPFQRYNQELQRWCQDSGRAQATFAELLRDDKYAFLDPPRLVLEVWVGSLADCGVYQSNLAAEQAEEEAESSAPQPQEAKFAVIKPMEDDDEGGSGMGSTSCAITNETDPFSILSISQDTNQWTMITWQSCSNRIYDVLSADELTTNTLWVTRAEMWGQAGTTSWTDTTTTNVDHRFYKVIRNPAVPRADFTGTNFWVVFSSLAGALDGQPILAITGPVGASGTASIPGTVSGSCRATNMFFTVPQEQVAEVQLPCIFPPMITNYDLVENLGIHITADQPVSAYWMAFGLGYGASVGFTGYPVSMLGTSYCVMARRPSFRIQNARSQFAVVATESSTAVTITPTVNPFLYNHLGTNAFSRTLQPGQTYQLCDIGNTNDVTGTFITSDKPIAVFSGASGALVPENAGLENALVQEQLPVASWGRYTLGFPLAGRTGDSYRVLAAYDDTDVSINGTMVANLQAGGFYDTIITNAGVEFGGSKPIQVAQYSNGGDFDSLDGWGDPFEMLLLPTGSYMNTYVVWSARSFYTDQFTSYLNLIVEQSAVTDTCVDGQPASDMSIDGFQPIGSSGYYGAQIQVEAGTHTVSSSRPLGVSVYGFYTYDSYGFTGAGANVP